MRLEELLRSRIIRRIKPNSRLALNATRRARRDIDTAKTLIENKKFDWSLAVSYNSILQAGRALMFSQGYRPSSTEGHVAVVKFLHASLGTQVSDRMIMVLNGMRKKRHRIVYEEMDIVSEDEAEQALKWAEEFVNKVDGTIHRKTE
ncbi:MAG: HEPN domain-containing protein [archaeon]|nr:HEPN domain-containing protein [archaeon]